MSYDYEKLMSLALKQAYQASKIGEVPIGAIIVDQKGEVIAEAHNLVEKTQDCTQHAEIIAIKEASKKTNNWRLDDCSIFVTLEPCTMCMGAILQSRITSLYFGAYEPRTGAAGSIYDLSNQPQMSHKIKVFPEIMEKECSELLTDFFKRIR